MDKVTERSKEEGAAASLPRCNHPLALLVDPTDKELQELEAMLARCPNCSRWMPGDGPIMATPTSDVPEEPIKVK